MPHPLKCPDVDAHGWGSLAEWGSPGNLSQGGRDPSVERGACSPLTAVLTLLLGSTGLTGEQR